MSSREQVMQLVNALPEDKVEHLLDFILAFCSDALHDTADGSKEAAAQKTAYFAKLDRGLEQVHAGNGIVKTIEELEAMEHDGP